MLLKKSAQVSRAHFIFGVFVGSGPNTKRMLFSGAKEDMRFSFAHVDAI